MLAYFTNAVIPEENASISTLITRINQSVYKTKKML